MISDTIMNAVKARLIATNDSCGNISRTEAVIAPMSAPMLTVLAMRRRLAIGKTTFLQYFFLITAAWPSPVTRPIRAHIS